MWTNETARTRKSTDTTRTRSTEISTIKKNSQKTMKFHKREMQTKIRNTERVKPRSGVQGVQDQTTIRSTESPRSKHDQEYREIVKPVATTLGSTER